MNGEIDAQAALRLRGIGALETSLVSLDDGSTLGVRPGRDWWEVLAWTPEGVQARTSHQSGPGRTPRVEPSSRLTSDVSSAPIPRSLSAACASISPFIG